MPLSFSHDDFDAAVQRASARGKLVFVDAWAEWCHTCLSMDSYVLSDVSLGRFANDFEFVALDTEKPVNEAFVERYEMDTWPTFFVIRPRDLELIGFWPGAGSVREMQAFLEQSLDTAAELDKGALPQHLQHFLAARRAQSLGKEDEAIEAYKLAYRTAPLDWARRSELLLGYLRALTKQKRFDECAALGKKHLDDIDGAARPAQFAQRYFTCLGQLKSIERNAEVERALAKLDALAYTPNRDMSFDDQIDALFMLAKAYSLVGRQPEAERAMQTRLTIAEDAAKRSETPSQAQTFDRVRALAYVDAGRSDAAVALLTQRERELPHGYAAPALLATILESVGRHDEALAALDRAVANSEGPRRIGYLEQKLALLSKLGRDELALVVLERVIEERKKLRGKSNQQRLEEAKTRRDQLKAKLTP